ncbi:MAG: DUF1080 domain-containing protein [Prevotellaceae bacterium]|jgi:hypothetical protein|nr:DUF1080 domain-containing protein [Prevotellaceae bacterium]
MKKKFLLLGCLVAGGALFTACSGGAAKPSYTILSKPAVDLSTFPVDSEGYIVLFDGQTLNGWRGYGKDNVPGKWIVEDSCIKFNGTGGGEAQETDGGDLIFNHQFKNFELILEWKISKGGNSGIFYLAQEVETKDKEGKSVIEPIYISSPEFQLLDNENHPDAKLGKDNNRKAASLYDMIPAVPQNAKPFDEWNTAKIIVYQGTVVHNQNDANVVEYHLWTPKWTELLQASKFSEKAWPLAFELLNNCGGKNHEGYIGLQDHGNDIWFKNIRIKLLD